mmetsp:Transcript_1622/g.4103  ORF Transcript_1622/g.4103 Transcript_1622/m.4103 type:complete len:613 (+) Transcript_1622:49-1887(+)
MSLNGEPVILDDLLGVTRLQEVLATIIQQLNAHDDRITALRGEMAVLQKEEKLTMSLNEEVASLRSRCSAQDSRLDLLDDRLRVVEAKSGEANRFQAAQRVRAPRFLGLGSPMRVLPEDSVDEDDDDAGNTVRSGQEYTSTAMSVAPLSPIKEVESPQGRISGPKSIAAEPDPATTLALAVLAAKSAAPAPAERSPSHTPKQVPEPVEGPDAGPLGEQGNGGGEQAKNSKVVLVNGVPYTQLNTIGRGGSSKVYLVQNPSGQTFALKRVATESAKQLEAFQNEVVLLRQLRDCDYVIQVVDAEVDRERGRINIVMEAGDMDLGRFLQSQPRLTLSQTQHLWKQMLEAVQVIHQERIVHSDLKPGNFLLINGRLKVIDFGIAKRISNDTTNIQRDTSVGTLSYMAPEAVKQGQLKLGRASDIWSLGIILYQMVYGTPPLAHLDPMQRLLRLNDPALKIEFPAGHLLENQPAASKALVEVLNSCLQRDPRRRPSLDELLAHRFLYSEATLSRASRAPQRAEGSLEEEAHGLPRARANVPHQEEAPARKAGTLSLEELLQRSRAKPLSRLSRLDLPAVPEAQEGALPSRGVHGGLQPSRNGRGEPFVEAPGLCAG